MKQMNLVSNSLEETQSIGRIIGERAMPGTVIALIGDLGSGKTSLTQGIAAGLQVPDDYYVTSPTFTLVNEYPGRIPLYHFDMYRLSGSPDLEDLGYEDYAYGTGLVAVEWAEKVMDRLPEKTIYIHMERLSEESRSLELSFRSDEPFMELEAAFKEGGFL